MSDRRRVRRHVIDYATAYREVRLPLTELLAARSDEELDEIAPATPEWRVRDVAAHLAGACDDIVHGRLDGVATDAWTAAQVAKRADWSTERLLADWDEHATVIESQINDWGPPSGQMLFDEFTHDQDIRGALGVPDNRESAATAISFDWFVSGIQAPPDVDPQDPRLRATIHLVTEMGETDILGPPGAGTTLRISRFEFLRVVAGRRSRRQMEALDWDGEPRVDDVCFAPLFRPAAVDIVE